ncbi:MAG: PEP/pyruvate-binding domain-containing protein, partial [Acidimicrobiia bacterium]
MDTTHRSSTGLTLELSRVSPGDAARVGVKAANQASLLQAGFPVPDGVVLTADAHASFIGAGSITGDGAPASLSPGVRHLLAEVMTILGDTPVAVRSSGIAEDLPDASFAGQYETVLGVEGLDELGEAVRHTWMSAASTHATKYRESRGLREASMAVLIQRMVDAEAAGVAFSANPVTGSRREVIINAVPG